jgi:hypothetical protein
MFCFRMGRGLGSCHIGGYLSAVHLSIYCVREGMGARLGCCFRRIVWRMEGVG